MGGSILRRAVVVVGAAVLTFTALGAPPAHAAVTYTVNSNADTDDGTCDANNCTLREALTLANVDNVKDTVAFNLPSFQTTIVPASPLPAIVNPVIINGLTQPNATQSQPVVSIDGSSAGTGAVGLFLSTGSDQSQIKGLNVANFGQAEILVDAPFAIVWYNNLGTDVSGTETVDATALGTLVFRAGADFASVFGNVVGSGSNAPAISLEDVSSGNVNGNYVGVSRSGNNTLGSGSGSTGIRVMGANASGISFGGNRIEANGALGIDLGGDGVTPNDPGDVDTGPNGLQNYPVLTSAVGSGLGTTVEGTLDSTPSATFGIALYASPSCDGSGYGEGLRPLGSASVDTDASGAATFSISAQPSSAGERITAIAASSTGDSEFSQCVTATAPAPLAPQNVTAAAGDGQAVVDWLPADTNGGSAIASYEVTSSPASTPVTVPASQTEATVNGLTNGTEYTFTVTATNQDGKVSPPSAPSDPVTPRAGAAAPEVTTVEASDGDTVSTGNDATAADPTNTTVVSPNGGVVSIAEGATTQPAPDGGPYYGQQVDITAPDASATDPLRFTFVVDCSVLPPEVTTCPGGRAGRTRAAGARASVTVKDGSYAPKKATVDEGGRVTWTFAGRRRHSVTESTGLGPRGKPLFDSGAKAPRARYAQTFGTAGSYAYASDVRGDPAKMKGTVGVPLALSDAAPASGEPTTVTWSQDLPAGTDVDVQYRHRATPADPWSAWTTWQDDTTATDASLSDEQAGDGDYQLRSRLQNTRTDRTSGWSPRAFVTLAGASASHLDAIDLWHQTDLSDDATNQVVPDCTGADGVASPAPSCVWSEEILPDGDLRIRVFSTINGRWRPG